MFAITPLSQLVKKKEVPAFFIAFCGSFLLFPTFFELGLYPVLNSGPSWNTLDPSWQLTAAKASIDHLSWGNDFVLTYGPLSFLSTRVGWGADRFAFLFSDLFMWLNFFYIFYSSYKNSANKALTALLIAFVVIMLPIRSTSGMSLALLAFLVFWIRQSIEENKALYYSMQILIIVLLFFIKFNTALISFVFFIAGLAYKSITAKEKKLLDLIYLLLPLFGIFLLAIPLNVSLLNYLEGGLNLVAGHNDCMYLEENYVNELYFAILVMLLSAGILLIKIHREKNVRFKNGLVFFLFSCSAYVLYKQGFVRADIQHILEFYRYLLLYMLCISDFHGVPNSRYSNITLLAVMGIVFFFVKQRDLHLLNFGKRISKTGYITGFMQFSDSSGFHLFPNNNQLRPEIKAAIGNSRVDVYPWNTHLLIENQLNYVPRPVFQSYLAYTPYLENLNFEFYNSDKAPDYVLYEFDAIDGRYPLFDEPKLNLVLLKNYRCTDTFSFAGRSVLVLKKNSAAKKIRFQKLKDYALPLSAVIQPQPGRYYELKVSNTLTGSLVSAARYAPAITLAIQTKDGREHYYRSSKNLLASGLFSTYFFSSTNDFYHGIKNDSLPAASEISGYRLLPKDSSLFKNTITVTEYSID